MLLHPVNQPMKLIWLLEILNILVHQFNLWHEWLMTDMYSIGDNRIADMPEKKKKIKVIEWVMKLIRLHGRQCSLVMASTAGKEHAVNTEWLKSCKLWEAAPTTLAMNVSSLKLSLGIFHVQKCQAENSTEQSGRQAHTVVLPYCTQFTDESDVRWTLNFPQFLLK